MGKYLQHLTRGLAVMAVITTKVPMMIYDGKISLVEMANFTQAVCEAGGWEISIDLSPDLADYAADVVNYEN